MTFVTFGWADSALATESAAAAIARQRDSDVLAGQLADAIGGNGRAVGIGLVVEMGQQVDEAERDIGRCFRDNVQGPAVLAAACARH